MVFITATPSMLKQSAQVKSSKATLAIAAERNYKEVRKSATIAPVTIFNMPFQNTSDDEAAKEPSSWVEFIWHGQHAERRLRGTGQNAQVYYHGCYIPLEELEVIHIYAPGETASYYYQVSDDSRYTAATSEVEVSEPYEHID